MNSKYPLNISILNDCYGCGVCAIICPTEIIHIKQNSEGFYMPIIDDVDKCISCKLCLDICAFNDESVEFSDADITSNGYAAWSNTERIRDKASSGGVGYEIGVQLIEKGYIACGVKYNSTKHRAEHFLSANKEGYGDSMGSKYIQSYTVDAFSLIDKKKKYLITGTPCQIDSVRRYIKKKKIEQNFILLDFFCHGVPSMLLWNKYIREKQEKLGKIQNVRWRSKISGWQDSWVMSISGDRKTENSWFTRGDLFYKMFLENRCLGKACYNNCKYKLLSSAADIRIGDLWGEEYKNNQKGVSGIVTFSSKGEKIIQELSEERCTIIEHNLPTVINGQMPIAPECPKERDTILHALRSSTSLKRIYLKEVIIINFWTLLFNKIRNIIQRKIWIRK